MVENQHYKVNHSVVNIFITTPKTRILDYIIYDLIILLSRYPQIGNLARRYLSIPATEVTSERIFSAAGLTITKLIAALDLGTVDMLIFLHKNVEFQV